MSAADQPPTSSAGLQLPQLPGARWPGDTRPPFLPGNAAAGKHGAFSQRRVDPVSDALVEAVLERRPDLEDHPEALLAWARAEARCLLLDNHYGGRYFDDAGAERPGLRYVAQFERLAAELRARLGLDPASEATLAKDRADATKSAVDLDAIRARGRASIPAGFIPDPDGPVAA